MYKIKKKKEICVKRKCGPCNILECKTCYLSYLSQKAKKREEKKEGYWIIAKHITVHTCQQLHLNPKHDGSAM